MTDGSGVEEDWQYTGTENMNGSDEESNGQPGGSGNSSKNIPEAFDMSSGLTFLMSSDVEVFHVRVLIQNKIGELKFW